jgi:hypothetical protein
VVHGGADEQNVGGGHTVPEKSSTDVGNAAPVDTEQTGTNPIACYAFSHALWPVRRSMMLDDAFCTPLKQD